MPQSGQQDRARVLLLRFGTNVILKAETIVVRFKNSDPIIVLVSSVSTDIDDLIRLGLDHKSIFTGEQDNSRVFDILKIVKPAIDVQMVFVNNGITFYKRESSFHSNCLFARNFIFISNHLLCQFFFFNLFLNFIKFLKNQFCLRNKLLLSFISRTVKSVGICGRAKRFVDLMKSFEILKKNSLLTACLLLLKFLYRFCLDPTLGIYRV